MDITTICNVFSIQCLQKVFYPFIFFPAVVQSYRTAVPEDYVIRGNDALVKCSIPSFVTDFVTVLSWTIESSKNDIEVAMGASLTGKQKKSDTANT